MTIWDDIRQGMESLPVNISTANDVVEVLEIGIDLAPITCNFDAATTRASFVKFAAVAAHGIELMDAEINAEAEAAQEADDEIPF